VCSSIGSTCSLSTAFVATIAGGIYRHRQRRWRKLVHKHLLPAGPAYAS
jgi:hypothetical protein